MPTACGRGFYKSSSQDLQCSRCPAHSFNDREGSWRCDCEDGYYRALSDPPSVACTNCNYSRQRQPTQQPSFVLAGEAVL
ncbi:Ephrin type-A receptor 7 [Crenichthys baileyi]|uniref:Ephrin type-A receptor 7 n=1 Tax=Crenichthys baileyi TaxID=28760 RepID=A0AAV9S0W4_9TELE